MPVVGSSGLGDQPTIIESLHDLFRQRTLLAVLEVSLELLQAAHAHDDAVIPAVLDVQAAVMDAPSEGGFNHGQIVLLHDGLDDAQSFPSGVFEISGAVHGAHFSDRVAVSTLGGNLAGLVLSGENATCNWVVDDNVQTVATAGGNELCVERAGNGVVHALVDGRSHPAIVLACHDDFCNLKGSEIGETKLHKLALLVCLVDGLECFCEWDGTVFVIAGQLFNLRQDLLADTTYRQREGSKCPHNLCPTPPSSCSKQP